MIETAEESERGVERPRRAVPTRWSTAVAVVAAFAIVMWGGYGHHWSWTGISAKSATLWDWLNLLMLPIAVAILPLWASRHTRVGRRHKAIGLSVLVAFAVVVVAGYAIPWGWTGFVGNKLWDWLELLVLPLTVALIPVVLDLRDCWTARHSLVALTLLVAFVVVVLGGYVGHWAWTGFSGNTLWNWLHLWLLPLLIPLLLLWIKPLAMSGVVMLDDNGQAKAPAQRTVGAATRSARDQQRLQPGSPAQGDETR
jgi:uncharacterized membrane protein